MALEIPINHAQLTLSILRNGDPEPYNVTWGIYNEELFYNELVLDAIVDAVTPLGALLASTETITSYTLRANLGAPDPAIFTVPVGVTGSSGDGARLPQNCAVLLTKNTGLGGRRNRGRLFWPSIAETQVSNIGILTDDIVGGFNSIFNGMVYAFDTLPTSESQETYMVILHNTVAAAEQPAPTRVTSMTCSNVLATQRRRLRR